MRKHLVVRSQGPDGALRGSGQPSKEVKRELEVDQAGIICPAYQLDSSTLISLLTRLTKSERDIAASN